MLPNSTIFALLLRLLMVAIDGYDLDALDYLLKPIERERFAKAVQKVIEYYNYKNTTPKTEVEALFVRSEYQLVKINVSEIEYIESAEDYLKIHIAKGRPIMTLMTLKSMIGKLPAGRFMRIHRSYVVPIAKIVSVTNKKVKLGSAELPVGDSYVAAVQDWVKGKW